MTAGKRVQSRKIREGIVATGTMKEAGGKWVYARWEGRYKHKVGSEMRWQEV